MLLDKTINVDCSVVAEKRLSNFVVGLTNDDPRTTVPVCKQYTNVQYNGTVAPGATVSVNFPPSTVIYRYVIIQNQFDTADALCLLEVKVFLKGMYVSVPCYVVNVSSTVTFRSSEREQRQISGYRRTVLDNKK